MRLRSDVPLGIFLSGGVDSSLVTAIARRECGVDPQTFSIGFDVGRYDESGHATLIAKSLGAAHMVLRVDDDLLGLLPQFSMHTGEPLGDVSALPLWVLAELTRRHVTVALAGDGGDELFGGYAWYATAARLESVHSLVAARDSNRRAARWRVLWPARGHPPRCQGASSGHWTRLLRIPRRHGMRTSGFFSRRVISRG